jgi:hypothetical protein
MRNIQTRQTLKIRVLALVLALALVGFAQKVKIDT